MARPARVEPDRLPIGEERRAAPVARHWRIRVKACFRLSRACGVAAVAPQQARQLVAGVGRAGGQREDSEQRAVLLARQVDDPPIGQLQLEGPQKP